MNERAYYNEIDPYCAQWLRNLIAAGHIADGDVDERSIEDVRPCELREYSEWHLFAGIGVWSYALRLTGWPRGRSVLTCSLPCQPFSAAGRGAGFEDERHLWPAAFHVIRQLRPSDILGEQVERAIRFGWIDLVRTDLEVEGYAFGHTVFGSHSVNSADIRLRDYWCATDTNQSRLPRAHDYGNSSPANEAFAGSELARVHAASAWPTWLSESGASALIDGTPSRVGRMRAYGNAINAKAAEAFIRAYLECGMTEVA